MPPQKQAQTSTIGSVKKKLKPLRVDGKVVLNKYGQPQLGVAKDYVRLR